MPEKLFELLDSWARLLDHIGPFNATGHTIEHVRAVDKDISALLSEADRCKQRVKADAMYLKLLLDAQAFKPDWDHRIRARLDDTARDFQELFPKKGEKNERP